MRGGEGATTETYAVVRRREERPSQRRRWAFFSGLLAFDGAGEAGHVVLDEERVYERNRHGPEERPRHELTPEIDIAADQLGHHAHGNGLSLRRGDEDQRIDELVPGEGEGEDAGGQDARHGD